MTKEIMKLVDDYAELSAELERENEEHGTVGAETIEWVDEARAAVVAALEVQAKDAARWKMLAEMEASMTAGETLRFYIAYPDKLDYVIELKHNAYDSAIAAQKEQI